MAGLFLSYRRDDSAGFAGRLADALEAEFGAGSVFRDVDDIRPGEDFVQAIDSQLRDVGAVLVMIGPRWLAAGAGESSRRLDDPKDFVRQEIEAALASGKPLIPLLVGGAVMPAEDELPPAIAGLARRQAVVLSDSGWRAGVARLVESLRPLLATAGAGAARLGRRFFGLDGRLGMGLIGGLALVALGAVYLLPAARDEPAASAPGPATAPTVFSGPPAGPAASLPPSSPPSSPPPAPKAGGAGAPARQAPSSAATGVTRGQERQAAASPAPAASPDPGPALDITGRWTARVRYDWGDEHDEVFEFKWLGKELRGSASYLTGRRPIEQARLEEGWLNFVTRSQEMLGSDNPWKEVVHRYTGQVTPEGIHFTLESGGGYSVHSPVEFSARRAPPAGKPAE